MRDELVKIADGIAEEVRMQLRPCSPRDYYHAMRYLAETLNVDAAAAREDLERNGEDPDEGDE